MKKAFVIILCAAVFIGIFGGTSVFAETSDPNTPNGVLTPITGTPALTRDQYVVSKTASMTTGSVYAQGQGTVTCDTDVTKIIIYMYIQRREETTWSNIQSNSRTIYSYSGSFSSRCENTSLVLAGCYYRYYAIIYAYKGTVYTVATVYSTASYYGG